MQKLGYRQVTRVGWDLWGLAAFPYQHRSQFESFGLFLHSHTMHHTCIYMQCTPKPSLVLCFPCLGGGAGEEAGFFVDLVFVVRSVSL